MKIVSIVNQKGGVGKSTTASALASGLARRGYRVLAIDLDAQANLTSSLGASVINQQTMYNVLASQRVSAQSVVQTTRVCDVIPSDASLSGIDGIIVGDGKEYRLKEAIQQGISTKQYDHIIIDTPPALGVLTVNALVASDTIVIPIQADAFSLQGVDQLNLTIHATREVANKSLAVDGILLTRYNPRSILSREITQRAERMALEMHTRVYNAKIRETVVIRESQFVGQTIFEYDPNSNVALDYNDFITEFIEQ